MYYLCEKYYKPIMVQYYIADCVSLGTLANFVGPMNKLDLWTHSQKGTCSYAGDLLYTTKKCSIKREQRTEILANT